jgi:hypothetical protein
MPSISAYAQLPADEMAVLQAQTVSRLHGDGAASLFSHSPPSSVGRGTTEYAPLVDSSKKVEGVQRGVRNMTPEPPEPPEPSSGGAAEAKPTQTQHSALEWWRSSWQTSWWSGAEHARFLEALEARGDIEGAEAAWRAIAAQFVGSRVTEGLGPTCVPARRTRRPRTVPADQLFALGGE